ncbi:E3 ubiquitin-protein ligase lubel-like isoform X2 [Brienomyrus brachyistius]|uniref:E3 ubiquitin-protein ligase lubel-like isoform X2 n=1 Tax=Brienomyrus brachyistius TaxID=42636 RepID=UPI0020B30F07|nr:E3 ubiquitin-protein ligase lubel-like isoform X2 [Brienomyrus brachyistius]
MSYFSPLWTNSTSDCHCLPVRLGSLDLQNTEIVEGITQETAQPDTMSASIMCPQCNLGVGRRVRGQRAVCHPCSSASRSIYQFCCSCRRKWRGHAGSSCKLPFCQTRAALLSSELIAKEDSMVKDCPFFRICPECRTLVTHSGEGCPNIQCPECETSFCFRCLKCDADDDDDDDDDDDYDDDDDRYDDDDNFCDYISCYHGLCPIKDNSESITALDEAVAGKAIS